MKGTSLLTNRQFSCIATRYIYGPSITAVVFTLWYSESYESSSPRISFQASSSNDKHGNRVNKEEVEKACNALFLLKPTTGNTAVMTGKSTTIALHPQSINAIISFHTSSLLCILCSPKESRTAEHVIVDTHHLLLAVLHVQFDHRESQGCATSHLYTIVYHLQHNGTSNN